MDKQSKLRLLSIAVFSRLTCIILCTFFNIIIPDDDNSARLLITDGSEDRWFSEIALALNRWDSLHFYYISKFGYTFEHQAAFFPTFPLLMHTIRYTLGFSDAATMLISALLSNAFFVLSAFCLYYFAAELTRNEFYVNGNIRDPVAAELYCRRRALISCVFFCIPAASVFFSAAYTESLFGCLSFFAAALLERSASPSRYMRVKFVQRWLATVVLAFAATVRSNGILMLAPLFFVTLRISPLPTRNFRAIDRTGQRRVSIFRFLLHWANAFVQACVVLLPGVVIMAYHYSTFCTSATNDILPAWCLHTIPNVYGYVQTKYWNVGLFMYWALKEIPNFCLALPVVMLSTSCVISGLRVPRFLPVFKKKTQGSSEVIAVVPTCTDDISNDVSSRIQKNQAVKPPASSNLNNNMNNSIAKSNILRANPRKAIPTGDSHFNKEDSDVDEDTPHLPLHLMDTASVRSRATNPCRSFSPSVYSVYSPLGLPQFSTGDDVDSEDEEETDLMAGLAGNTSCSMRTQPHLANNHICTTNAEKNSDGEPLPTLPVSKNGGYQPFPVKSHSSRWMCSIRPATLAARVINMLADRPATGYAIQLMLLALYMVLCANIQVITRLVTCCPLLFVHMADLYLKYETEVSLKATEFLNNELTKTQQTSDAPTSISKNIKIIQNSKKRQQQLLQHSLVLSIGQRVVFYVTCIVAPLYFFLGPMLFSNGLPWT